MRFYTCMVTLEGDVRHVVQKQGVTAAEIQVLQAIHGVASVFDITAEPVSKGRDNTPHKEIANHLDRTYGRTRVGSDNNPRPVLTQVFPGWPNAKLPRDAKAAGIDPGMMVDEAKAKKAASKAKAADVPEEPEEPEEPSDEADTDFTE